MVLKDLLRVWDRPDDGACVARRFMELQPGSCSPVLHSSPPPSSGACDERTCIRHSSSLDTSLGGGPRLVEATQLKMSGQTL